MQAISHARAANRIDVHFYFSSYFKIKIIPFVILMVSINIFHQKVSFLINLESVSLFPTIFENRKNMDFLPCTQNFPPDLKFEKRE